MHHGPEFTVVVIAVLSLAAGALMRVVSRLLHVPYTIGLLLLGLLAGVVLKGHASETELHGLSAILNAAAAISPHLIIFVFLPALVFESAFALEVYGFRRNLGAILVLAGPALVLATVATAHAVVALTAGSWNWSLAAGLAFGALISATDPVAVVAILRELGAPKRLGILIEGESLLNDGTAIVVFNVLIGMLATGGAAGLDVGAASLEFVRVVAGGCGVGLGLAAIVTYWLKRTFNDPLVEITLTVVLAYAAMLVAEGLFHVSGVMALVSAGLWMSGHGRTRISPEVAHFLHQFWEMLAYMANTLIFLLVGLVVATQFEMAHLSDLWIIVTAYGAVMAIRFVITFGSLPLLNRIGDRVSTQQATVMSWGGLRGAVSLALALAVSQRQDLDLVLRHQVLLLTAGVVFLTIVLNGSSMGWLLARFGFDKPPVTRRLAYANARAGVLESVGEAIAEIAPTLKTVQWSDVHADLARRRETLRAEILDAERSLESALPAERVGGVWLQALNVERQACWTAFNQGVLGARALKLLDREIEMQIDRVTRGDVSIPESRAHQLNRAVGWPLRTLQRSGFATESMQFEALTLGYDLSRAQSTAAEEVLTFLERIQGADPELVTTLKRTYQRYRVEGTERLEDLRTHLPEITAAIETRMARRIRLNLERDDYHDLLERGVLEPEFAHAALHEVEAEMKLLMLDRTRVALPETADLCRSAPLFAGLDAAALDVLAKVTREQVFSPGEALFRQGELGASMFIIARGAVHVLVGEGAAETLVGAIGGGDILGEMALLTGQPRTATCRAATTVTAGEITRADFETLMRSQPALREGVWQGFARREFDNLLRHHPEFAHVGPRQRREWIDAGQFVELAAQASLPVGDFSHLFVFVGSVEHGGHSLTAPALVRLDARAGLTARSGARLALLREPPERASPDYS